MTELFSILGSFIVPFYLLGLFIIWHTLVAKFKNRNVNFFFMVTCYIVGLLGYFAARKAWNTTWTGTSLVNLPRSLCNFQSSDLVPFASDFFQIYGILISAYFLLGCYLIWLVIPSKSKNRGLSNLIFLVLYIIAGWLGYATAYQEWNSSWTGVVESRSVVKCPTYDSEFDIHSTSDDDCYLIILRGPDNKTFGRTFDKGLWKKIMIGDTITKKPKNFGFTHLSPISPPIFTNPILIDMPKVMSDAMSDAMRQVGR